MFTRARIYGGDTYLKNHLSANDYYAEGEKVAGRWIGRGAALLGLEGEVRAEHFEALRNNRIPDTEQRLTPRTKETRMATVREAEVEFRRKHGREGSPQEVANFRLAMKPMPNRVAFYDYQCSAQKSVSIMAMVAGDGRLREAHNRATAKAFAELERLASRQCNTLTQRGWETTCNLCAAAFTHDASRALDPQLHTHFVIANATYDPSGRWYALEECFMYKAVRYAGKVYQNELACEVKALGYDIREVRNAKGEVTGFEIEGVSEELCERFSKRRAEIEAEIERFEQRRGRAPTTAEIAQITRDTRNVKLAEISTPEVQARQRGELSDAEWESLQSIRKQAETKRNTRRQSGGQELIALRASVDHLFERQSVAKEHEILAEALNQRLGFIELRTLQQALADGHAGVVHLDSGHSLMAECATKRGLELERWSVAFVNATKDHYLPLNAQFKPDGNLSPEQREAVRAILSTRDQVFSFRGVAGAGKTTALKEIQRGLSNRCVYYIAPTASAAKVLQGEGFQNATTVDDFLQNVSKRGILNDAIVICDEAGLSSNQQGAELLHLAQQNKMRVLFVGDARQHVSVEAGDFLRVLETHSQLGRCEVSEIRRQQDAPAYKAAVTRMAMGDAKGGLLALDELGWLKEGRADYIQGAVEDYIRLTDGGKSLDSCLMIAPTWEENYRLTESIRAKLKTQKQLPTDGASLTVYDSLRWTNQQKRCTDNYAAGQRVTFTCRFGSWRPGDQAEVRRVEKNTIVVTTEDGPERRLNLQGAHAFEVGTSRTIELAPGDKILIRANDKRHGLVNGQVLTVERIEPDQSITTGEGLRVPASFKQWCHGYVLTSHKSQGRTCEHVIVAAEKLDVKAAYVACSRGKRSCIVHTPDQQRLLERLPEGNRRAALDVLAENRHRVAECITKRAEIWTQLFGPFLQKAAATRELLRRRMEETRQMVQRWTQSQKVRLQHHTQRAPNEMRFNNATTQDL